MKRPWMPVRPRVEVLARVPGLAQAEKTISALEIATLFMLGVTAACLSAFVPLKLGIPGHNIIRVVFPMVLGLALVPRRGAGSVMAAGGCAAGSVIFAVGVRGFGVGAFTSLALTGFFLDLALTGARAGWSVYLRFALAGLATNLCAFAVRGGTKAAVGPGMDGRPIQFWWQQAIITYAVCGLLAGLLSAAVWFRAARRPDAPSTGADS